MRGRTGRGLLGGALASALLLSGCGAQNASLVPVPLPYSPTPAPTPVATATFNPAPTIPLPSGASVARDPSLLALLPASVGGVAVKEEPGSLEEAAKDPAFVASVDRADYATAVSASDIASGVIAHLRTGVYSDAMFADWRSTYDEGACAQSNGVLAHASQTQGSRTTYVTTCGGGLRVYHTYLAAQGVIVSLLSIGPDDLGAQLMAAIRG